MRRGKRLTAVLLSMVLMGSAFYAPVLAAEVQEDAAAEAVVEESFEAEEKIEDVSEIQDVDGILSVSEEETVEGIADEIVEEDDAIGSEEDVAENLPENNVADDAVLAEDNEIEVIPDEPEEQETGNEAMLDGDESEMAHVTLDANGGYFNGDPELTSITIEWKREEYLDFRQLSLTITAPEGKILSYWENGGVHSEYNDPNDLGIVHGDKTCTAIWKTAYSVTFDANGGYFDGDPEKTVITETYEPGVFISGQHGGEDQIYNGEKVFLGWARTKDATSNTVIRLESDEYLYAVWVESCEVTFDANGGYFDNDPAVTTKTISVGKGEYCRRTAEDYGDRVTCSGKTFVGWSTDKSGASGTVTVGTITGDVTYYAIWKEASGSESGDPSGSESGDPSGSESGDPSGSESGDPEEHVYGDWTVTKEATCTEDGTKEKVCIYCGDKITETIPKKEHSYGEWSCVSKETCTEDGLEEAFCINCEDRIERVIPAPGHVWNDGYTVDKEATCTEDGSMSIHCVNCGISDETTIYTIAMKGHSYSDWTVTKEATCKEEGSREQVCSNCGDKITEVIPLADHAWKTEYTVDKEPTYTEEGSESYHCAVCDLIKEGSERSVPKLKGWFKDGDSWKYNKEDGSLATGWLLDGSIWYFMNADGIMQTGWQNLSGIWYYMNDSGAMVTGWQKIGNVWYYFNGSGAMVTGWQKLGSVWYYFNGSGAMVTGWQKLGSVWYYFNGSGAMVTGWQKLGSVWYYFNGSGAMVTGWQKIGSTWYYFNASGAMQTGWQKISGKWYYFNGSGAMLTGRQQIGGKWYTFNSSGVMQ